MITRAHIVPVLLNRVLGRDLLRTIVRQRNVVVVATRGGAD